MKKLTKRQVAERLGLCVQRVQFKLDKGHFPNHTWCECGISILIPESDLALTPPDGRTKKKKLERARR